jgi:Tol biopolymer transport system component
MDRMSSMDLDRQLTGWFATAGADYVPEGLLEDVFGVTRTSGQRRGAVGRLMTAATNWWRTPVILRLVPRQVLYVVVVALLVIAAAIAIATAGAQRPAPPFGLAANGVIAFDRDGAIVMARPDGTEISKVTSVPDARGPVFAPDGSRFAFYGTVDGAETIIVAEADGRHPIAVSTGVTIDDLAMETPVSWSPDSRSVVFGGLSGEQRQLFVARVDGSDSHAIGDPQLFRMDPAWSPDGAWIAFHGFNPAEDAAAGEYRTTAGLYLIRPDGRDQTLLVKGNGGDFIYRKPQWLPDPERRVLAYAIGNPSAYDIATFDLDSMTQAVVSDEPAAEIWPAWAPDGSALAWAASDNKLRVARADGTNVLTFFPTDIDYEVIWSPDGRYLLGWSNEARDGMTVVSSDGSSATTGFPMRGRSLSHWSWQRRAP